MPYPRPTLTQLREQAKTDLGVAARLRYSNEGVIAEVLAGQAHGHYGYLDWIARQSNPFTATGENAAAWGALKGKAYKSATPAGGAAIFAGANGVVVPAGATVSRADGVEYAVMAEAVVTGGTASLVLEAKVAAAAGNADDGVALNLATAIAGITSTGYADGPLTGGADVESDDDFKARYLAAFAAPPQGGSRRDYPDWALGVPGVTRAWVRSSPSPGVVVVYVMMDLAQAVHDGFPQGVNGVAADETRDAAATGDQLAVADAIFLLQPITALVYVNAPAQNTVTLTLDGLAGASAAIKTAVEAAIDDVFLREGDPIGGVVDLSEINSAVAAITGTAGFVITAVACNHGSVDPAAGNITSAVGYLPVRGAVTYT